MKRKTTTKFDLELYREVSEQVLDIMKNWCDVSPTKNKVILMDLRDAVFKRAGERCNGSNNKKE